MSRSLLRHVCLACVLLFAGTPIAQETTAAIQGTVKDATGAVVANATVELSGPALISPKKAQTDSGGFYKIAGLPPGEYTMTVAASGFRNYRHSSIDLNAGRLPVLDVQLQVGATSETVEVSGDAPIVDVTQSKVSVTVDSQILAQIPKGRSFQSVIPFAPGARQEPLTSSRNGGRDSGFQVDGATDSENAYLVDGVNVTEIRGGGVGKNFVMDFVQEVQIKSSSFEAEYGGALGGVINAVPKRGGKNWHGEIKSYFRFSALNANDPCSVANSPYGTTATGGAAAQYGVNCFLRAVPGVSVNGRLAPPAEYYLPKKDTRSIIEPGFELGGALVKDRVWLFTSYIPTLDNLSRTINFTGTTNPGVRTLTQKYTQHNAYARLDYRMFDSVQLFGSWNYGYARWTGPTLRPDSITGQRNTDASTDPNTVIGSQGVVLPSSVYTFGGDWTPTPKLVISGRYGYIFLNGEDRNKATGLRYVYNQSLVSSNGNVDANGRPLTGNPCSTDVDGKCLPSSIGGQAVPFNTVGFSNMGDNFTTYFDAYKRKSWNWDASYFVSHFLGTHNLKGGFFWMNQGNEVLSQFNTARVNVDYNNKYTPVTTVTACDAIIAANQATYGPPSASNHTGDCRGLYGYFTVTDGVDNSGSATSIARAIYMQDAWTVGHGLTLNLGVRFDQETVPSFNKARFKDIEFGWGSKIAPRIGGAWDVFHNGKVKFYASYGKFFDIMKLGLPRGSLGSDYWHDCIYALDTVFYTNIVPTAPGGHGCPASGEAAGVSSPGFRFIENVDFRATKLDPRDPAVDPNIKPVEQHEAVAGVDWAITPNWSLETRYTRKRLDRTIEDMAITDDLGFYIGNPGSAFANHILHGSTIIPGTFPDPVDPTRTIKQNYLNTTPFCAECPNAIPAIRRYDAVEIRLTRRPGNGRWFGSVSYSYSKLRGNYSGLTDTDITDGNGGRHAPNNHRAFDLPVMSYLPSGKADNGPLATDRPNTLKMYGYYRLPWLRQETIIGVSQSIFQGTPNSTCLSVIGTSSSCQWAEGRGNFVNFGRDAVGNWTVNNIARDSRTDAFLQTDLSLHHEIRMSKTNEARRLGFEANIINVFNQHAVMALNELAFFSGTYAPKRTARFNGDPGFDWTKAMTGYDYLTEMNATGRILSQTYGKPILFQGSRNIRFAIRYIF